MRTVRGSRRGVVGKGSAAHGEPVSGWTVAAAGGERRDSAGNAGVRTPNSPWLRLLSLGAGPRLVGAAFIVAMLWGAFYWATSAPGGS